MTRACRILLLAALLCPSCYATAHAAEQRIHVYSLNQQYWDVRPGDTLGGIAEALLPDDARHRAALMSDILRLNPGAFIGGNPHRLRTYVRLWLPNVITRPLPDRQDSELEQFDWGYIKRAQ